MWLALFIDQPPVPKMKIWALSKSPSDSTCLPRSPNHTLYSTRPRGRRVVPSPSPVGTRAPRGVFGRIPAAWAPGHTVGAPRRDRARRITTRRGRLTGWSRPRCSRRTPRVGEPGYTPTNNTTAVPTRSPAMACATSFVPNVCVEERERRAPLTVAPLPV